jgi:hypothetical protein
MHSYKHFAALITATLFALSSTSFAADDEQDDAPVVKTSKRKSKSTTNVVKFKVDKAQVETGSFLNSGAPDSNNHLHAALSLNWQPSRQWEAQLGARLDGYWQTGTPDFSKVRADYTENFIRWRGENSRVTFGTQNIAWGRTDEIQPIDRLSRVDLNRFILDTLPNRRRAVPAVRLEQFIDNLKLDAVWVPSFQAAELPPWESVWHPVDRRRGLAIGVLDTPATRYLLQNGSFAEEQHGTGGGGIRLTRSQGSIDWGLSLQRVRQSTPYYRINPDLRAPLLMGATPAVALAGVTGPTFTAIHPMSTVGGAELEFQAVGATWRFEGAYATATPATTQDLRYITSASHDLVAGVEFFPGDKETRATLQLAAHQLHTQELVQAWKSTYAFTGDIEHPFGQGRWRANLRFASGINHHDNYVSPRLTYLGFDAHEVYLTAHLFSGEDQSIGGFHRDHNLITLGWQARF